MGLFLLAVLVVVVLAVITFAGSGILYLVTRIFKVVGVTYKKSLKIFLGTAVSTAVAGIVISLLLSGLGPIVVGAIVLIVQFAIYHFFFKKYYQLSWGKSLGIFVTFSIAGALLSAAVVIPVRVLMVEPFLVSGEAMAPTYPSGEYLFINKISKDFNRGDVIVFRYPLNQEEFFIKRIVGLPGDKVKITNGQVFINGQVLEESYYNDQTPGNTNLALGSDEYFVMGDNREASSDSRVWGPVKSSLILGKILVDIANFAPTTPSVE